jgi:hypothetical protein
MSTAVNPIIKIDPGKPLGELTPAQKKQRYAELRQRLGESKLKVEGLPGKHYYWAHTGDGAEMVRLEGLLYSIVREPFPTEVLAGKKKPVVRANGLRTDGTYVIGDVILTCCDTDVYDYLMLDSVQKGEEAVQSATDDFKLEAEKSGVPVFETKKKE